MRHLDHDRLLDLLDGSLNAATERVVRDHLASCGKCAVAYRSQREIRVVLAKATVPPPDTGLLAGLMAIQEQAPPPAGSVRRRVSPGRVAVGTTVAGSLSLFALAAGVSLAAAPRSPVPPARHVLAGMASEGMAVWFAGGSGGSGHRR